MRFALPNLVRALALGAALVAAFAAAPPAPVLAETVEETIKAMKDFEKSGDEGKCIGKMQELKDSGDSKVLAAVRELVKSKSDKIACSAIRMSASRRDVEFLKWLLGRVGDKKLADKDDGRPDVYKCILETIGVYRGIEDKDKAKSVNAVLKSGLKELEDVVKKFLSTDAELSTRAIHAYGTLPELAVVDQLVKWLEEVGGPSSGGQGGGGGGGGKGSNPETRENKDKARVAIVETLNELTGKDIGDGAMWRKYWDDHRKGFTFPEPGKKEPEVDVTVLKEYTDPTYAFTVKRPEGGGWAFEPKDPTNRLKLSYRDETKTERGRIEFQIHNTTTQSPNSLKGLIEYWQTKGFPENEFSEFSETGKPKIEELKISGREALKVSAKGQGKNNRQGWGSMERRVYATKCDYMGEPHLVLVAHITCANGMEQADKDKLYKVVEGLTLKAGGAK